jgi:hypothetical protein
LAQEDGYQGNKNCDERHNKTLITIIGLNINNNPVDGISTLSKALRCWVRGLVCTNELESYAGGSVAVGRPPIPDWFRDRCKTKRDILVLQVGGWAWG